MQCSHAGSSGQPPLGSSPATVRPAVSGRTANPRTLTALLRAPAGLPVIGGSPRLLGAGRAAAAIPRDRDREVALARVVRPDAGALRASQPRAPPPGRWLDTPGVG